MHNIHLALSSDRIQELNQLAAAFHQELEDRSTPPFPTHPTLNKLKDKLLTSLEEQEGFKAIWQAAKTQANTLCLSHENTQIRNLPWQIATEGRELLSITKSYKNLVEKYQPSVGYPLKVLVMIAAPEDIPRLAYEEEELQLLRAFSPLMSQGLVEVHFTEDGSLENLQDKLEENKYHILHYSGHGSYHDNTGSLALEDSITGKKRLVTAEDFNKVLAVVGQKGHQPELIVLSACQTAQGVEAGNLSGVADTLMQGGIPAVIAMSASILDSCATIFAAELYEELSKGFPLPSAFQKARLAVKNFEFNLELSKIERVPGQWLIPQLLLNQEVN